MRIEALKLGQLVVEFWTRLRTAVEQIDAADQNTADGGLDVAPLDIARITGQRRVRNDRLGATGQYGHAVPRSLPAPYGLVADRPDRKLSVSAFEFLQATDARL